MSSGDGRTTYRYRLDHATSTYLATVVIGAFERIDHGTIHGVALRDYLPADLVDEPPSAFAKTADMIDVLDDVFGPFPFAEYGHVVVPGFPGAMENPTLSLVGRSAMYDAIVVHEIAHQWFGDSVTPASWRDIWLNEGFATYAEWLWLESAVGPGAAAASIRDAHRDMARRDPVPPGDPGPRDLFDTSVYLRGALTLHALRVEVGDEAFFRIVRTYADRFAGSNASTDDFVALAEDLAGRDLGGLFDAWLFGADLPPLPS